MSEPTAPNVVAAGASIGIPFTDAVLAYVDELKGSLSRAAALFAETACARGKRVSITVDWAQNCDFNAWVELVTPDPNDGSALRGGDYKVTVSEGLLVKLIYAFEIVLTVVSRTGKRAAYGKLSLYTAANELAGDYVVRNDFFQLDFEHMLVGAVVQPYAARHLCEQIEEAFWPFELTQRRVLDMVTKQYVWLAANFLMLHECAHVGRGHLEYLENSLGVRSHAEVHMSSSAGPRARADARIGAATMRHHMEHDADMQAIYNLIQAVMPEDEAELALSMSVLTSSLALLFSMFDMSIRTLKIYEQREHPDPDVRIYAATTIAALAYQRTSGEMRFDSPQRFLGLASDALLESVIGIVKALVEMGVVGGGAQRLLHSDRKQLEAAVLELIGQSSAAQAHWVHRMNPTIGERA